MSNKVSKTELVNLQNKILDLRIKGHALRAKASKKLYDADQLQATLKFRMADMRNYGIED